MIELQTIVDFFQMYGYAAVFGVLVLCGLGIPIPEDISLVGGGIISGLGYTNVHVMFAVGMAGVLIGDGTMFTAGRVFGSRVFKIRYVARIITPERVESVGEKFRKYGKWILFAARFMPGLRSVIFVTAGTTGQVSYFRFLATDGLAALISVPIWVYLGFFGAHEFDWLMMWVKRVQTGILVPLALGILALIVVLIVRKRRARRRRLAEGVSCDTVARSIVPGDKPTDSADKDQNRQD